MKKVMGLAACIMLFSVAVFGILLPAHAEAEMIPKGDFTISENGIYQLSSGYEGTITVSSAVYEVTVTDSVYKTEHLKTGIVIQGGRTADLELTIEDLNINAGLPDVYPHSDLSGIDFGAAGNYEHKLYISGTCSITGSFNGQAGINVPEGVKLTIDKAEGLTDGQAVLAAAGGRYGAGIGGSLNESGGTINITGGTITATSEGFAAGIGGGTYCSGGDINISGGIVTASDEGSYGAAIGGGWEGTGGNINISGGKVRAIGSYGGAGIGGGMESYSDKVGDADGGNITISGGEVIATVGGPGAAIGGGWGGSAGNISISGGTVTATAFGGAGIGNGMKGTGGSINISGGIVNVEAYSGGAGIGGGGSGTAGSVTISGGEVTVTVASYGGGGAGIGGGSGEAGGNIDISGGTVIVTGSTYAAGIGGGDGGDSGNITIIGGVIEAMGGIQGSGIGGGVGGSGDNIIITGGTVTAISRFGGAGIGGGNDYQDEVNDGGNITINGGHVRAISGGYGAGIGGGNEGSGGNITINGGYIEASCEVYGDNTGQGAYGAGIGGGSNRNHPHYEDDRDNDGGTVTINSGTVIARGGSLAAGIGGGEFGKGGTVEINGGTVEAYGGGNGAGIGGGSNKAGGKVSINGGTVKATGGYNGAGIGGGSNGIGADVTILNTPIVIAIGSINEWLEYPAKHIGNGGGWSELNPGTLKDGIGNSLSYLKFNTSPVASVNIRLEGTESLDGDYLTDGQGIFWLFVPYTEGESYSYTMGKAGYAAVGGNRSFEVSSDISDEMVLDDTIPEITGVIPAAVNTGDHIAVTCADYGIYGTVYMTEETETNYTSKAGLEAAYIEKLEAAGSVTMGTTGLAEGNYKVYLADSAENVSVPADIFVDNTPPTAASKGITLSDISYNSIKLTWNEANDNLTNEENLEYIIYKSLLNNIDSVENIEANGTIVTNEEITGIGAFTATGFNHNTIYYLNIIVKDMAGNKTCYNSVSARTKKRPSEDSDRASTTISPLTGMDKTETFIPVNEVLIETGQTKEVKTDFATVTIPSNMLAAEMLRTSPTVMLVIGKVDISKLPAGLQLQIGGRPVIELALKLDGKAIAWNNPNAPVTVSIPYVPTPEELKYPENITVWYIDGAGNAVSVPSGRYDPATGSMTFTTTHFSSFAVVFVKRAFNDLDGHAWAKRQIEVLSAKGIVEGRAENEFAPAAEITRAEYIGALVRTLGATAQIENNFIDVMQNNSYYNEIAIARKLGITNGTGDGSFRPGDAISRQDMLVLTERALRSLKRISSTGTKNDLEQYTDRDQLADYSVPGIAALVKEGLIKGSSGRLSPGAYATRAEAAVFLYRLYNME